jgi:hypothetical protein
MKYCKGCYYSVNYVCVLLRRDMPPDAGSSFKKCPCNKCLVKSMCVKRCETFINFYRVSAKKDVLPDMIARVII